MTKEKAWKKYQLCLTMDMEAEKEINDGFFDWDFVLDSCEDSFDKGSDYLDKEVILKLENYIAQLVGINHDKLTFDFKGDNLTVRELEKEFISLEDSLTVRKQAYEKYRFEKHHLGNIDNDIIKPSTEGI